ncbi:MAG TPA: signal peptide peptidase SppA [bacterium]|nr:signal peptide peptidase SppA [bacterium]HOL96425.1 signal peptide peptidase SppA [bacterium]HPP02248.1 signal peptide peptidase SppA [bacterium]HXK95192.1 signal peptide peptidase SppA [bacterium]
MKKSTGLLLFFSFLVMVVIMVGLFVTLMILVLQGTTPNLLGSKRLALVRVESAIYDAQRWIDQIKHFQEDDSIKGIVLRVESPGGAVGPSQDLYEAIRKAQTEHGKIVVASFGSLAASGGYYIACSADRIVASPGTLTGSIGVYAKFPVAKELMEKIGVDYQTIKAGEYKDFGSIERGLSDKERAMFQSVIDDTYDQFVEAVAHGRKRSLTRLLNEWKSDSSETYPFLPDVTAILSAYQAQRQQKALPAQAVVEAGSPAVAASEAGEATPPVAAEPEPSPEILMALACAIAEGKIYTGRQAKEIGLVDEIGSLEDAIALAGKLAGIPGKPTVVEQKKREFTLLDLLTQGLALVRPRATLSPLLYEFPY